MKKLSIIILFVFSFLMSFSQGFTPPRSSPYITVQDSRWRGLLNAYLPHTHGLTLNGGLDTLGAIIYDDSSQHIWYRDTVLSGGHAWRMLLKTGDIPPAIDSAVLASGGLKKIVIGTSIYINSDSLLKQKDSGNTYITPTELNNYPNIYNSNGTLTNNRTVSLGSSNLTFNIGSNQLNVLGTSAGIYTSSASGNALFASGGGPLSAAGFQVYPSSTNTIFPVIDLYRQTSATPANGIGGSIDYYLQATNSQIRHSNQLISKWTNVTDSTRTSEFSITGINNTVSNTLLSLSGNGGLKLNSYGSGSFTGTPTHTLSTDAAGNIIETGSLGSVDSLFGLQDDTAHQDRNFITNGFDFSFNGGLAGTGSTFNANFDNFSFLGKTLNFQSFYAPHGNGSIYLSDSLVNLSATDNPFTHESDIWVYPQYIWFDNPQTGRIKITKLNAADTSHKSLTVWDTVTHELQRMSPAQLATLLPADSIPVNNLLTSNSGVLQLGGTAVLSNTKLGFHNTDSLTIDSVGAIIVDGLKPGTGTPNILVHMPDSSIRQMPYPTGGVDSAVNPGIGLKQNVAGTTKTLYADTSFLARVTQLQKVSSLSDTTYKVLYGIPYPTGTGVNGDPIYWKWLTGGGHSFSQDLDSCIFVGSNTHLQIGFPTAQTISFGTLAFDEQTFPFHQQVIGNQDNFDFGVWLQNSGVGVNLVGNGTSTWQTQNSQLGTYVLTIDTSTQGIVSFDLQDGASYYLGAITSGTMVQYTGSNGYTINRIWSGLTRGYRYQLLDAAGNPVIGAPTSSDRLTIFNGSSYFTNIDQRQFLTATNPFFVSGLPNYWFMAVVKVYPDSLKIIRPPNFAATPGSSGTINVTWSPVANAGNFYELDRSTNPNFSGGVTVLVNFTNVTSFNDTGLSTGTTYYYRLRASRIANVYSGWELRSAVAP